MSRKNQNAVEVETTEVAVVGNGRGAKNLQDQILALEADLTPEQIERCQNRVAKEANHNEIRYCFKLLNLSKKPAAGEIGKRDQKLLDALPENQRAQMKALLEMAKKNLKSQEA